MACATPFGGPIVSVSPIIGGLVIKGPIRKIMNELGIAAVRRAPAA